MPMDSLHLVLEGEYESTQKISFVHPGQSFDFKEFLPHTKHKYSANLKS
jgi:hypothetical protein